jgi:hypothetical protein
MSMALRGDSSAKPLYADSKWAVFVIQPRMP